MIHFIVNPHARSGEALALWNELENILNERHIKYIVHLTEYAGHAIKLADELSRTASEACPITIGIFGGDGTVNEVYNGISTNHRYITLGYIPTGSGNDFARGLSIPRDSKEALNALLKAASFNSVEHGIATNSSTTRKFAVSCGIGYDADVTYRVYNSKLKKSLNKLKLGKLVYTVLGVLQVFISPKLSAHIVIDENTVIDTDCFYFASINVLKYEGGGWPFALHADPSDGKLSVCMMHDTSRLSLIFNLLSCIFSKHEGRKGVSLYDCRQISIKLNQKTHSHTDGECFGEIDELTASACDEEQFVNVIC